MKTKGMNIIEATELGVFVRRAAWSDEIGLHSIVKLSSQRTVSLSAEDLLANDWEAVPVKRKELVDLETQIQRLVSQLQDLSRVAALVGIED